MNDNLKVPKRISTAILNSMTAGVVPRVGLEYVTVGRKNEIQSILSDLSNIEEGASVFRFIAGRYGSGKSFLLQVIRNYAMDRNFIVTDVDLAPEKRLTGTAKQGLATYRELMQRLSSKSRPDGGALEAILQKWINGIKTDIINEGISPTDSKLDGIVEAKIYKSISKLENYAHGFDIAAVLAEYYKAYVSGNDEKKQAAIKWLRGEFSTKTEAKAILPISEIISDDNWYEYIKLLASFSAQVGYKGFIIFLDEGINLYKIQNKQSRENNYEKLLYMFNDAMQGKAENLAIYMGGTPEFIEDKRRGLFSYEALRSRLVENRFTKDGYTDFNGPILRLKQLAPEEVFVLLERLTQIHELHYKYTSNISEQQILSFLQEANNKLGSDEFLTPREVTRDYLGLLNILLQDDTATFDTIVGNKNFHVKGALEHDNEDQDVEDEYKEFTV